MKKLNIGRDGFKLPLEAVTQTFAVLAIRGAGKTNTCVVMAEEMLSAGAQVVVIDPTNSWWGLRSSRDGKEDGFPITVLGGDHGDLPLEATAGKVLADFVVLNNANVIFSVRHMSKGDRARFVADFAEHLFHLKDTHRTPMHLILDEADRFVPQKLQPDQMRMYGAVDDLVRLGRSSGIGISLISQRAAVINKDVLSQTENLICLRTIGKHDRTALKEWAEAHSAEGELRLFMDSLASLERGEAWVWSPFWLKIFERIQIRERTTFDSSATPEFGKILASPKRVAKVDLDALQQQMAATIERAKADDPRELKKTISDLRKQLKEIPASPVAAAPNVKREEEAYRKGFADGGFSQWENAHKERDDLVKSLTEADRNVNHALRVLSEDSKMVAPVQMPVLGNYASAPAKKAALPPSPPPGRAHSHTPTGNLTAAERRILGVLAQRPNGCEIDSLAALAVYTVNGHFNNTLGGLRGKGYITQARVTPIQITQEGIAEVGEVDPLPTGKELQRYWLEKLSSSEARIMQVLFEADGIPISIDDLAGRARYTVNGHFNNMVGGLRTKGLMSAAREPIRAAKEFFE